MLEESPVTVIDSLELAIWGVGTPVAGVAEAQFDSFISEVEYLIS